MSTPKPCRKQDIVVVGGGLTGSVLIRRLSAKLDPSRHNLTLIDARAYSLFLIAGARLTVDPESRLEDRCFVPFDNVFVNGNGTYKRGRVVAIDVNKTEGGVEKDASGDARSQVVLETGERISFDALILATGSSHSGPIAFPVDQTECIDHVNQWRNKFKDAEHICMIGGGGVAIELAGELKDRYPNKKVTIVHGQNLLLKKDSYPDKFRKYVCDQLEAGGVELVLGEYVESFPESGPGEVVLRSGKKFFADLVVPTYGPQPRTDFIASSLGDETLTSTGFVKIRSTLQLESHPSIFAIGDIIDFPEGKRAYNAGQQVPVVIGNILSYLKDPSRPLKKEYKGSFATIVLTNGKNGGMGYIPILWGIIVGNWLCARLVSRNLHVDKFRQLLGM